MILRADGISLSIRNKTILDGVSVRATPGKLVGLIGPNGAGKSTMLRVMAGLRSPDAGQVVLGDKQLNRMPLKARARTLAYMPQERVVHWPIKVRDLVALGRLPFQQAYSSIDREDYTAIENALEMMDIDELSDRSALTLSGGELARVLMARAFAQNPKVLLADEPTSGLDPAHQLRLLKSLRKAVDDGMTVILVLHDLTLAARYCDTLVLLNNGQVHITGTPQKILTEGMLQEVYGFKSHISNVCGALAVTPVDVFDLESRQ